MKYKIVKENNVYRIYWQKSILGFKYWSTDKEQALIYDSSDPEYDYPTFNSRSDALKRVSEKLGTSAEAVNVSNILDNYSIGTETSLTARPSSEEEIGL